MTRTTKILWLWLWLWSWWWGWSSHRFSAVAGTRFRSHPYIQATHSTIHPSHLGIDAIQFSHINNKRADGAEVPTTLFSGNILYNRVTSMKWVIKISSEGWVKRMSVAGTVNPYVFNPFVDMDWPSSSSSSQSSTTSFSSPQMLYERKKLNIDCRSNICNVFERSEREKAKPAPFLIKFEFKWNLLYHPAHALHSWTIYCECHFNRKVCHAGSYCRPLFCN